MAGRSVVRGNEIRSSAINIMNSDTDSDIRRNLRVLGLKPLMIVDSGYGIFIAYATNSYGTLERITYSYEVYKLEKSDEIIQGLIRSYELYDVLSTASDIQNGAFLTENDIILSEAEGSIIGSIFYGLIDWLTSIELPPELASKHLTLVAGKNNPLVPANSAGLF